MTNSQAMQQSPISEPQQVGDGLTIIFTLLLVLLAICLPARFDDDD